MKTDALSQYDIDKSAIVETNGQRTNQSMTSLASDFLAPTKAEIKEHRLEKQSIFRTSAAIFIAAVFSSGLCLIGWKVNKMLSEISSSGAKAGWLFYIFFTTLVMLALVASIMLGAGIVAILLSVLSYRIGNDSTNNENSVFAIKLLRQFQVRICTILALVAFPFILSSLHEYKSLLDTFDNVAEGEAKKFPTNFNYGFGIFMEYHKTISNKLFLILMIFFLKNTVLFVLNYSIQNKVFYKKKALNDIKLDILKEINTSVNASLDDTVEQVAAAVILNMSRDGKALYFTEVAAKLGEDTAEKLFAFADPSGDLKISKEELIGFYRKSLSDSEALEASIAQTSSSIDSMNGCLTFLAFVIVVSVVLTSSNTSLKEKSFAYLSTVVSGSYIFSDTIKKFLTAIAFVFFIRSFEVGDVVRVKGELCTVKNINLLSTTFTVNNLTTTFCNDKLYEEWITNLSVSESMDENYTYKFDPEMFKKKSHEFLKTLKKYFKEHSNSFTFKPYFSRLEILSNDTLRVDLIVGYQLKFQELEVIQKRRDNFMMVIHDEMNKCGLLVK